MLNRASIGVEPCTGDNVDLLIRYTEVLKASSQNFKGIEAFANTANPFFKNVLVFPLSCSILLMGS